MCVKWWIAVCLAALATSSSQGQSIAEVTPPSTLTVTGDFVMVSITIDLGPQALGSYGATLTWNPAVLQFQSWAGGTSPFDNPVVNTAGTSSGSLAFADANASGAAGPVVLLDVTFQVAGEPPDTTVLDLELSSLFAAGDFEDLAAQASVEDGTTCVADFSYGLAVTDPQSTLLTWTPIVGAVSYDVIRGDLSALFADGAGIHLGDVFCLEDDSTDTSTGAGTEPSNPDTGLPLPGEGFFYLVRFDDGIGNQPYGYFADCAAQRIVDSSDCP